MTNNGIYNMLFGENEYADQLLDMLGLDKSMFGRYRDCYLNADGTRIIVVTRCGGKDRYEYDDVFARMRDHNNYLGDYDDSIDETYCYFEFGVPVIFQQDTMLMATGKEPLSVGNKFNKEIQDMRIKGSDAEKRAQRISKYINNKINEYYNM